MEYIHKLGHITNLKRKSEQLNIALYEQTEFINVSPGFDDYRFIHQALPEIDLKDVNLSTVLFGKNLAAPIIISSMVGGNKEATRINRNLAQAAQNLGLAMGVGSQRCLIENPETSGTYRVRDIAPDILLFANLGAVQLNYGYTAKECQIVVESIGANALILHLNSLQEALQPDGNTNFAGLLDKIEGVCRELTVPVIIKEIGCGISEEAARKLAKIGISGIDIAGAGGTCWSEIEKIRTNDKLGKRVAGTFRSWGIPTTDSVIATSKAVPQLPIIASGGIRTGIDVAKAIALGADAAGIAKPLLKAADDSAKAVENHLQEMMEVLKITMFCIGAVDIKKLKMSPFLRKL